MSNAYGTELLPRNLMFQPSIQMVNNLHLQATKATMWPFASLVLGKDGLDDPDLSLILLDSRKIDLVRLEGFTLATFIVSG